MQTPYALKFRPADILAAFSRQADDLGPSVAQRTVGEPIGQCLKRVAAAIRARVDSGLRLDFVSWPGLLGSSDLPGAVVETSSFPVAFDHPLTAACDAPATSRPACVISHFACFSAPGEESPTLP